MSRTRFRVNPPRTEKSTLYQMLDIVTSYHCMQCRGKCNIQTQENGEKLHFGPHLAPLGPISGLPNFCFKNLAPSVTRYHSKLSSCTMPEKAKDLILRTLSDGWTGR